MLNQFLKDSKIINVSLNKKVILIVLIALVLILSGLLFLNTLIRVEVNRWFYREG